MVGSSRERERGDATVGSKARKIFALRNTAGLSLAADARIYTGGGLRQRTKRT